MMGFAILVRRVCAMPVIHKPLSSKPEIANIYLRELIFGISYLLGQTACMYFTSKTL